MNIKQIAPTLIAFCAVAGFASAPVIATAQSRDSQHRNQQRNEWRDRAVAGGVIGAVGLLTHNNNLAAIGIGGGLYSAYRADQDGRSHDDNRQAQAELYRHSSFQSQGHTYVRQTVWQGGKQYHKFNRRD